MTRCGSSSGNQSRVMDQHSRSRPANPAIPGRTSPTAPLLGAESPQGEQMPNTTSYPTASPTPTAPGVPQQGVGGMSNQLLGQVLMMMSMMLNVLAQFMGGASGNKGIPSDGSMTPPPDGEAPYGTESPTLPPNSEVPTEGGATPPDNSKTPTGKPPLSDLKTPPPTSTTGATNKLKWSGSGKVQWDKAPKFIQKWKAEIQAASARSGMPESLLAAMVTNESSGNHEAVTTNQNAALEGDDRLDVGLMQINGNTYKKEIAVKHPDLPKDSKARYRPDINLLAGAYYVKDLPFGSWEAKLRAYNSGPGCTDPNNPDDIKPNDENGQRYGTPGYPSKIKNLASRLEAGTLNW